MDFVTGIPLSSKKKDAIWVIVDWLTKSAHFIPVRMDYPLDRLAELYVFEIVRLHRMSVSIISYRDPLFTSRFWNKLQEALGTQMHFSTAFHPRTDDQSERVILILKDMLRCCVLEFEGNWESLKVAFDRQKSYADLKRKEIEFQVGDKVFLKMSPWKKVLQFGHKGKLCPRFIRPYEITERIGLVAYQFALPPELYRIHNVFHLSMLWLYQSDLLHITSLTEVEI
ncbi:hypothetical protein CXB51_014025 [Gossypium anomalum]|uniref:Integrase catalytic domain-containing protein n=1 Tax=Gossypium anomalum TaxID=47600 RepID=A0A8J6CX96_9ROSI|nr:hypothetical protein CXB51_014025 [Gossypium anomalum]